MPGKDQGRYEAQTFDPFTNSAQWSRRFIGLKLFMALAEQGEAGYAEMIDHQARMGDVLRESLRHTGWRIVNSTPLPLVCFTREGLVPSRFLAASANAKSRGCRKRGSTGFPVCAHASPVSGPPNRTSIG